MLRKARNLVLLFYSKTHDLDKDVSLRYFAFKLVWLVSLIVAIFLCVFFIFASIIQYYRYDVSTEIRDIYLDNITFPVVTICNANPLGTAEANEFIRKHYIRNYNVSISTGDDFLSLLNNGTIKDETDYIFYTTYEPGFNRTLRESFGFNSLVVCFMNDMHCNVSRDFKPYYSLKLI